MKSYFFRSTTKNRTIPRHAKRSGGFLATAFIGTSLVIGGCDCGGGESGWRDNTEPHVAEIRLAAPPEEHSEGGLFAPPGPQFYEVLDEIYAAAKRESVEGVFLRVSTFRGGIARATELSEALDILRKKKKPVHCHFESADTTAYYLLSKSCDRISMTPAGTLDLVGVAMQVVYARSALKSLGVDADIFQVGKYKGTGDMFTRDDMPEETRQSLGAILNGFHAEIKKGIAKGRKLKSATVAKLIDGGPYASSEALDAKLVDDIAFVDEARQHIRKAAGEDRVLKVDFSATDEDIGLIDMLAALSGDVEKETFTNKRIALVLLTGSIVDGSRPQSGQAVSDVFISALRRLRNDEDVKAVVLRIDSPGGSALASDRMWHAVRQLKKKKPVLVSVGEMAASGGYYIACAADKIYADPASLVGSIGVVGGKMSVGPLLSRLEVTPVTLRRGQNAAWGSLLTPLNDTEKVRIKKLMHGTYDRFIRRVASSRKLDRETVLASAGGILLTGRDAKERKLVDEIGSLEAVLKKARALAGVPESAKIEVWPRKPSVLDGLAGLSGKGDAAKIRKRVAEVVGAGEYYELAELGALLTVGKPVTMLPYTIEAF